MSKIQILDKSSMVVSLAGLLFTCLLIIYGLIYGFKQCQNCDLEFEGLFRFIVIVIWILSPYSGLLIFGRALRFYGKHLVQFLIYLLGCIVVVAYGIYEMYYLSSPAQIDGQNIMMLIFFPIFQWGGILFLALIVYSIGIMYKTINS